MEEVLIKVILGIFQFIASGPIWLMGGTGPSTGGGGSSSKDKTKTPADESEITPVERVQAAPKTKINKDEQKQEQEIQMVATALAGQAEIKRQEREALQRESKKILEAKRPQVTTAVPATPTPPPVKETKINKAPEVKQPQTTAGIPPAPPPKPTQKAKTVTVASPTQTLFTPPTATIKPVTQAPVPEVKTQSVLAVSPPDPKTHRIGSFNEPNKAPKILAALNSSGGSEWKASASTSEDKRPIKVYENSKLKSRFESHDDRLITTNSNVASFEAMLKTFIAAYKDQKPMVNPKISTSPANLAAWEKARDNLKDECAKFGMKPELTVKEPAKAVAPAQKVETQVDQTPPRMGH